MMVIHVIVDLQENARIVRKDYNRNVEPLSTTLNSALDTTRAARGLIFKRRVFTNIYRRLRIFYEFKSRRNSKSNVTIVTDLFKDWS